MRGQGWGWAATIAANAAGTISSAPARAGLYQDDLSRCLVAAATPTDRTLLLRWVFASMAVNPKINDMAHISDTQAKALSVETAGIMQRFMLTDCRKQTIEAIRYEGAGAIQQAFSMLGQIAMSDLTREEATSVYMADLGNHLDKEKWEALGKEAGTKIPAN